MVTVGWGCSCGSPAAKWWRVPAGRAVVRQEASGSAASDPAGASGRFKAAFGVIPVASERHLTSRDGRSRQAPSPVCHGGPWHTGLDLVYSPVRERVGAVYRFAAARSFLMRVGRQPVSRPPSGLAIDRLTTRESTGTGDDSSFCSVSYQSARGGEGSRLFIRLGLFGFLALVVGFPRQVALAALGVIAAAWRSTRWVRRLLSEELLGRAGSSSVASIWRRLSSCSLMLSLRAEAAVTSRSELRVIRSACARAR